MSPPTGNVPAEITSANAGGFTAVASTDDIDRDGERLAYGCFDPLPASIPVHLDHNFSVSAVVARAVPRYDGGRLLIDAKFGRDKAAQEVRDKVTEGLIDSVSVVFKARKWATVEGVRTLVSGELLACDLVSVPSNRGALVLSSRSYLMTPPGGVAEVRRTTADALIFLARLELAESKTLLSTTAAAKGTARRTVDSMLAEALATRQSAAASVHHFLGSL